MGMGAKVEKREGMKQKHDKNENMIQGQQRLKDIGFKCTEIKQVRGYQDIIMFKIEFLNHMFCSLSVINFK